MLEQPSSERSRPTEESEEIPVPVGRDDSVPATNDPTTQTGRELLCCSFAAAPNQLLQGQERVSTKALQAMIYPASYLQLQGSSKIGHRKERKIIKK